MLTIKQQDYFRTRQVEPLLQVLWDDGLDDHPQLTNSKEKLALLEKLLALVFVDTTNLRRDIQAILPPNTPPDNEEIIYQSIKSLYQFRRNESEEGEEVAGFEFEGEYFQDYVPDKPTIVTLLNQEDTSNEALPADVEAVLHQLFKEAIKNRTAPLPAAAFPPIPANIPERGEKEEAQEWGESEGALLQAFLEGEDEEALAEEDEAAFTARLASFRSFIREQRAAQQEVFPSQSATNAKRRTPF